MRDTFHLLTAFALSTSMFFLTAIPAGAQHHEHGTTPTSPYAGQQNRAIKALSDLEIENYRTGAGMGYAKAAELNGYPGPIHVLALKADLNLSADQERKIQAAYDAMQTHAIALGNQIVEQERLLDQLFAGSHADSASVAALTERIATLQGELRAAHLNAHLSTHTILTPVQIRRYIELRGYTGGHGHQH